VPSFSGLPHLCVLLARRLIGVFCKGLLPLQRRAAGNEDAPQHSQGLDQADTPELLTVGNLLSIHADAGKPSNPADAARAWAGVWETKAKVELEPVEAQPKLILAGHVQSYQRRLAEVIRASTLSEPWSGMDHSNMSVIQRYMSCRPRPSTMSLQRWNRKLRSSG
jgi:hypothetical protein